MSAKSIIGVVLSIVISFILFSSWGGQERTFVTIGTGGITGVYYPTGGAISRLVNEKQDVYNVKATVASSGGSVFNINAVLSGDLEFGVAQSDRQYEAFTGLAEWEASGPQKNLRSLFSIYPESVTLIASEESAIQSVSDLKEKRVNLGNKGSGNLQNARSTLQAFGLSEHDLRVEMVKASESPSLLQDGRIDAFFYTVRPSERCYQGSYFRTTAGTYCFHYRSRD